jgi:predicted nucleotidyltransferase
VYDWPEFRPRPLLERLVAGQVDFVVIGGLAAVVHGSAAITRDLDITYSSDPENLDRLGSVLVSLDARLRGVTDDVPFVPDGRTLRRTRVLTLDTAEGRLDLLAQPDGSPAFERLRERAWRADLDSVEVQVASLDDLIAMKKAAGRPKDLVAVEELEAIQRLQRER